jgi:glycogen debranching enzyme
MAGELGETKLSETYKATADTLKRKINKEFWVADYNSYADFLGTDAQALQLIADAIVRADTLDKPWAVSELKATAEQIRKHPSKGLTPFVVHHNWVVNTPMEMGIADSVRAIKALETASGFVNPFGVFVTGIDRDASAGTDEGSFKGSKVFSYTGAVMTLPTGVLAVAENNYGRPDKALEYLQRLSRSFSYALPGSIYEVSPDYGMITQAWTIYSYAIPIIQQFFGIQPKASLREVIVRPEMPSSWDTASLENVIVADNEVSVYYELKEGFCRIRVEQTNPEWTLRLQLPLGQNQPYQVLQGNVTTTLANGGMQVSSTSKIMELKYPIQ